MEFVADSGGFWVMKGDLQVLRWDLLNGFAYNNQPESKAQHAGIKEFYVDMDPKARWNFMTEAIEAVAEARKKAE